MRIQALADATPFVTADGSTIRELIGPVTQPAQHQSLAEATLPAGQSTQRHYHRIAEEIYYIVAGAGRMELDGDVADVEPGDAIMISPGAWHQITALGDTDLRLLCCCAPPYSHDDTYFE
jgi:mannose-6-phosphate isomerase-like protein (cupin superfamily)